MDILKHRQWIHFRIFCSFLLIENFSSHSASILLIFSYSASILLIFFSIRYSNVVKIFLQKRNIRKPPLPPPQPIYHYYLFYFPFIPPPQNLLLPHYLSLSLLTEIKSKPTTPTTTTTTQFSISPSFFFCNLFLDPTSFDSHIYTLIYFLFWLNFRKKNLFFQLKKFYQ